MIQSMEGGCSRVEGSEVRDMRVLTDSNAILRGGLLVLKYSMSNASFGCNVS